MSEALRTWLQAIPSKLAENLAQLLAYPLNPAQRLYWLYLASTLGFALLAWWSQRRRGGARVGFLAFCFPREVWSHPSAWLDVRYFFFHQILRISIYGGLVASVSLGTFELLDGALRPLARAAGAALAAPTLAERALLTLVSIALVDFTAFAAHVLQHRVPLLWEFHRVHHSLPVMHPLSNYREHPVDNLLYALVNGATLGLAAAGAAFFLGCRLAAIDVLGINAFLFAFNFLGYNLRHSHIWIAWPPWLGRLFGSPAYHQIHHSVDPRHLDRNLAFIFPVWDWLFGTQVLPREREALRFGLGDGSEPDYDGVFKLYILPFARIARGALRTRP